jgi:hypothetical protein
LLICISKVSKAIIQIDELTPFRYANFVIKPSQISARPLVFLRAFTPSLDVKLLKIRLKEAA